MDKKDNKMETKFTEENLRFEVVYRICEFWDFPEINREDFEWDGEQRVEQKLCGILTVRQFLWLIFDAGLEESINTMGIQIESGHIIPAVDFYHSDTDNGCYVSVYTDEMKKVALAKSEEPSPTPVVQNDFSVKEEMLSFAESGELWQKMVDALPEIVETFRKEDVSYGIDDDTLDVIVPKMISKLNELRVSNLQENR
jgi:hypothetical protein